MKGSVCVALFIIAIFFVPGVISARHIAKQRSQHGHHRITESKLSRDHIAAKAKSYWESVPTMKRKGAETLQIAGSSLPDCSHACGSCTPCRLVTVSFVCASLEEAETCPVAYKCMCHNKSYPVP